MKKVLLAAVVLSLAAQPGRADDAPAPDKSGYSLFNPTPPQAMRPLEAERPTKILNPFTVDAGHIQVESDFLNYFHANSGDLRTQLFQFADPTIKLGVAHALDIELALNGAMASTTRDRRSNAVVDRASGFGDTILKAKLNLVGNDGGAFALAVVPFVKLPTAARGLGNGVTEAGVALPAQFNLPSDFTFAAHTELDSLKKANVSGHYANFVNIVNLGHPLTFISKDLSASVELFSSVGTDRATPPVYTFDLGIAYVLAPNVQLDAGVNFGLNKYAPNLDAYAGVTSRF
jgi:hypothetical protein